MCLRPAACTPAAVGVQRFLTFPATTHAAILRCLRRTLLAEGFAPIPVAEWVHVLSLADPLLAYSSPPAATYRIVEGQHLLQLLLSHYLDVLPGGWQPVPLKDAAAPARAAAWSTASPATAAGWYR